MRFVITPAFTYLVLLCGCDENPTAAEAMTDREASGTDSGQAPVVESSGGISSGGHNIRYSFQDRFDKELLPEGYELEAMRSFIQKNIDGLSKDKAYNFQRKVLIAAREHNFEGCLDVMSEDIDSFDQELNVGGELFSWAASKGDQTVEAYLAKIEDRSTNPDAYRYYSRNFIAGAMSAERDRIDDLVAYTLKLDDHEKLSHFCEVIASSFQGPVILPDSSEVVWSTETPSESPMENSDVLITLLEERGRNLERHALESMINRAFVAGVVRDKTEALRSYSKQAD